MNFLIVLISSMVGCLASSQPVSFDEVIQCYGGGYYKPYPKVLYLLLKLHIEKICPKSMYQLEHFVHLFQEFCSNSLPSLIGTSNLHEPDFIIRAITVPLYAFIKELDISNLLITLMNQEFSDFFCGVIAQCLGNIQINQFSKMTMSKFFKEYDAYREHALPELISAVLVRTETILKDIILHSWQTDRITLTITANIQFINANITSVFLGFNGCLICDQFTGSYFLPTLVGLLASTRIIIERSIRFAANLLMGANISEPGQEICAVGIPLEIGPNAQQLIAKIREKSLVPFGLSEFPADLVQILSRCIPKNKIEDISLLVIDHVNVLKTKISVCQTLLSINRLEIGRLVSGCEELDRWMLNYAERAKFGFDFESQVKHLSPLYNYHVYENKDKYGIHHLPQSLTIVSCHLRNFHYFSVYAGVPRVVFKVMSTLKFGNHDAYVAALQMSAFHAYQYFAHYMLLEIVDKQSVDVSILSLRINFSPMQFEWRLQDTFFRQASLSFNQFFYDLSSLKLASYLSDSYSLCVESSKYYYLTREQTKLYRLLQFEKPDWTIEDNLQYILAQGLMIKALVGSEQLPIEAHFLSVRFLRQLEQYISKWCYTDLPPYHLALLY